MLPRYYTTVLAPLAIAFACIASARGAHAADTSLAMNSMPSGGQPQQTDIRMINRMARAASPVSKGVSSSATAVCKDGSISSERDSLAACAYRGGIARWFGPAGRGVAISRTVQYPG